MHMDISRSGWYVEHVIKRRSHGNPLQVVQSPANREDPVECPKRCKRTDLELIKDGDR